MSSSLKEHFTKLKPGIGDSMVLSMLFGGPYILGLNEHSTLDNLGAYAESKGVVSSVRFYLMLAFIPAFIGFIIGSEIQGCVINSHPDDVCISGRIEDSLEEVERERELRRKLDGGSLFHRGPV